MQSSKRNQNPSRYYNSITNFKFQRKSQNIIFQKSSYKNRPIIIIIIIIITLGSKSLKLLYSIMNPNTISFLAMIGKANKNPNQVFMLGKAPLRLMRACRNTRIEVL